MTTAQIPFQSTPLFTGAIGRIEVADLTNNIPTILKERKQWVLYGYDKKPMSVFGGAASVNEARSWGTFEQAIDELIASRSAIGIGFVFTEDDDFAFIDFDDKPGKEQSAAQKEQMRAFIADCPDSYVEQSLSGSGVHAIVYAPKMSQAKAPGGRTPNVEIYTANRYAAFTGQILQPPSLTGVTDASMRIYQLGVECGIIIDAKHRIKADLNPEAFQSDDSIEEVINQLVNIDFGAHYDNWLRMAMALKHEGEVAREHPDYFLRLFIDASRRMSGFQSEADCRAQWMAIKNYRDVKVTMGTLNQAAAEFNKEMVAKIAKSEEQRYIAEMKEKRQRTATLEDMQEVEQAKAADRYPELLQTGLPGVLFFMTQHFLVSSLYEHEEAAKFYSMMHLAHFVAPHYVLEGPLGNLYLNQFALALQPSGAGKEAYFSVLGHYREACGEAAMLCSTLTLPSSAQALHDHLAPDPEIPGSRNCDVTLTQDESSGFFAAAFPRKGSPSATTKVLTDYLNQLFSASKPRGVVNIPSSIYGKASKRNMKPIEEPTANLMLLSQPAAFEACAGQQAFITGFLGRFTTLYTLDRGKRRRTSESSVPYGTVSRHISTALMYHLTHRSDSKARTRIALAPGFLEAWDDHCERVVNRDERAFDERWGSLRMAERALKLAGLLVVAEAGANKAALVLSFAVYEQAYELVRHWTAQFIDGLGGAEASLDSETRGVAEKIMERLHAVKEKHGKDYIFIADLAQKVTKFGRMDASEKVKLLNAMKHLGMIVQDGKKVKIATDES
jgi:hypothetical protein